MILVVDIGWIEHEAKMIGIQCFRENEYIRLLGGWHRWRRRNSTVDTSSVFSGMSTAAAIVYTKLEFILLRGK